MGGKLLPVSAPFPRSYWVVPGKLLAGCYPGSLSPYEEQGKLRGLLEHGICHVINLMETDEFNWDGKPFKPYQQRMESIARSMAMDVKFARCPIRDGLVCTHADMVAILDRIDSHIEQGKPVYIHCWGGRGRTGTVVGCYLIRHGMCEASEAVNKIRRLRKHTQDHRVPSPETKRQLEIILSWVEGQ